MATEELTSLKFVAPKRKEVNPDELTIVQATQVCNHRSAGYLNCSLFYQITWFLKKSRGF